MHTLFIDTHFLDIRIILFKDGKITAQKEVINQKNNSKYIFPTLISVITNKKIDNIIVVNGPGSFTGVRLGVTIAKTLAYLLNIPIRTISSLECLAISSNNLNVAIDDQNGYYVGYFKNNLAKKQDFFYVNKKEDDITANLVLAKDIKLDYVKIYNFVKQNKVDLNPHFVNPLYVKKIAVSK